MIGGPRLFPVSDGWPACHADTDVQELFVRLTALFGNAAGLAASGEQRALGKTAIADLLDEMTAVHLDAGSLIRVVAEHSGR